MRNKRKLPRIRCAAIRYQGHVYEGASHADIGVRLVMEGVCQSPFPSGDAQGFVTEDGEFVDREAALTIALAANQIRAGRTLHRTMLFSEDLR